MGNKIYYGFYTRELETNRTGGVGRVMVFKYTSRTYLLNACRTRSHHRRFSKILIFRLLVDRIISV